MTEPGEQLALEDGGEGGRPLESSSEGDETFCWICFDAGPNESGEPLVRDCSCRGTSGHAHLSCIDGWARQKAEHWDSDDRSYHPEYRFYDLFLPWLRCCKCKQMYQRLVGLDLIDKLLKFVEENYPDNPTIYLHALKYKVTALWCVGMLEEAKRKAEFILSNVGQLKEEMGTLSDELLSVEGATYNDLGNFMFISRSGTTVETEQMTCARMAVEYFEKALAAKRATALSARNATNYVADAEAAVAIAHCRCDGDVKWALTAVEKSRISYNSHVASHGPGHQDSIVAGMCHAYGLYYAHRALEAEKLAAELVAISKQYHGPCNFVTKTAEEALQICSARYATIIPRKNIYRYTPEEQEAWGCNEDDIGVLGYKDDGTKISIGCGLRRVVGFDEDGAKCILEGGRYGTEKECSTITVDSENVRPELGTPVVCHGLKESSHLNGKIGEVRSIDEESGLPVVHFADPDIEPQSVEDGCMRILFDLPDESEE
ncbi:hypothetical protein ACHAXT_001703 [Thalassiosira profunda]